MAADPPPAVPPTGKPKQNGSPTGGLVIPLLLIAAAGVVFAVFYFLNTKTPPPADASAALDGYLIWADKYASLSTEYTDADGDLVADTPADAKEPDVLYFTEIPGTNPDKDEQTWADFLEHMSKATGKSCKYLKKIDLPPQPPPPPREGEEADPPTEADGSITTFDAQRRALHDGKLHVTAFTTGQVRQAVNAAGFRPLVVPADKDGKSAYQVEVLVPASSPVKTVADLKGKTVVVSALSSNSGAKAPFVLFHDEFKLHPRTDYKIKITGSYWAALADLVGGKADAVCIASDLLARELAYTPTDDELKRGRVQLSEDKFRRIYKSGDYPKLCFGVSHTLPKPLRDKLLEGFRTFAFGGAVGEKYKADGSIQFLPVEYKTDWERVRKIDDRLAEILKKK